MKIFDLNKSNNYNKDNLQKNINSLKKEYGNKFLIKYKKFNIPVKFQFKQLKFKNLKYLCLKYDIEKQIEYLLPFMINFKFPKSLRSKFSLKEKSNPETFVDVSLK